MDMLLHVVNEAQNVFINVKGVEQIALEATAYLVHNYRNNKFGEVAYHYVRLSTEFHPHKLDPNTADWLFVLNTLNFSLWAPKGESEWTVDGLTGYLALCAAIKRAIDEEKPIWNPKYYAHLSMADMKHIFRGDNGTIIPKIFQRLAILHIIGKHLLKKYEGTFVRCIKSCRGNPEKLMNLLQSEFMSYKTNLTYDGKKDPMQISVKAWILVTDIWATFRDHELSLDMKKSKLPTIFVDYRVFQVLSHFNVILYSKNFLKEFEKKDEILMYGSKEELEIRCCSVMVINHMRTLMKKMLEYFAETSIPELAFQDFDCTCLIDNFLWDYRQLHDEQLKKYPLCKICTEQY